ncbi:S41 family peptidase [Hymenobacter metallicola]|uniref:Peptidase n=1 Tax=Hymenobacter metallicola TaxID=2563114 RepID=A0A4Z0QD73_9BACT|nr:S41 family peptidase [Hymenobacter metallicola]TGE27436.1 peptidase [Hymenobacter metallicola]
MSDLLYSLRYRFLVLVLLAWAPLPLVGQSVPLTPAQYQQDFEYFWTTVQDNYCYFDKKQTDWPRVRQLYAAELPTVTTRAQFVRLLENALAELYDSHASLSTNRPDSRRLIPTATDVWAQFVGSTAVVFDVRRGYGAARAGLQPGMELVAINDVPVAQALQPFLGRSLKTVDAAAREVALNLALAGDHRTPRKFTALVKGKPRHFYPDQDGLQLEHIGSSTLLESRRLGTVGYIKLHNSLGDNRLIAAFDSTLTTLQGTTGLILDLRETPSGGNTTVARALMGRFITQEQVYQRHELTAEQRQFGVKRSWLELVSPRGPVYSAPLVVLVGRWTGSMPEGITIGLDAMKRATTMGTEMARLNGAIVSYRMPNSGIGFSIPTERLFTPAGLPRENFVPAEYIQPSAAPADQVLEVALQRLGGRGGKP